MPQTRQLAAIMFTDIVGYTALMGKDEKKAFELLNKNRQIQKPIIEEYNGTWIKELGDGVMASFNTVSDAVNAAIKIQDACNTAKECQLRIGIHQGEVVIEEHDVFGDAVNIASRIQSIATPGSIFVSEVVHHNVANKNEIETEYVKTETLKNVKQPVKIYRVKLDGSVPLSQFRSLRSSKNKKYVFVLLGIVVLAISGYFIYTNLQKTQAGGSTENADKSIAVLPFDNTSIDKDQEYFSDGLSEELLNMLAKIPELKVIGRTSSFAFKGKDEDSRSIGKQLGVAHLLVGSVRKQGDKIRVIARLINAADGSSKWSDDYDGDLKNIFKLQEEIAQDVVKQLRLKLLVPSTNISGTGNVEAYNLILQGNYFFDKLDKDNIARAVEFYNRALAMDSTDPRVWACLANAISRQSWQNYIDQHTGYEKARQAAFKAIDLDSAYAPGYVELGDIKLYHDFDWNGAEEAYQKALRLQPSNADILTGLGDHQHVSGRCREAAEFYKKALVYNPLKPIIYLDLGNALSCEGRLAEAIPYFKKILEINPQYQRAHMYTGRNYLLMGKPEQALPEMQQENLPIFKTFGLTLVYHALGRKKEADEKLKEFTDSYGTEWSFLLAEIHAFRGEKEEALKWLENAYANGDSWLYWIKSDPLLKNIEDDPRYRTILKKMNLSFD